jgi:hypothetical protein
MNPGRRCTHGQCGVDKACAELPRPNDASALVVPAKEDVVPTGVLKSRERSRCCADHIDRAAVCRDATCLCRIPKLATARSELPHPPSFPVGVVTTEKPTPLDPLSRKWLVRLADDVDGSRTDSDSVGVIGTIGAELPSPQNVAVLPVLAHKAVPGAHALLASKPPVRHARDIDTAWRGGYTGGLVVPGRPELAQPLKTSRPRLSLSVRALRMPSCAARDGRENRRNRKSGGAMHWDEYGTQARARKEAGGPRYERTSLETVLMGAALFVAGVFFGRGGRAPAAPPGRSSARPCSPATAAFARSKGRAARATRRTSITWCRLRRRRSCSGSPRVLGPGHAAVAVATGCLCPGGS